MRVESVVAQQAVLAAATQRRFGPGAEKPAAPATLATRAAPATPMLPSVIADRLAGFLAADPSLADAISAHLPAARQACARDFASYRQTSAASRATQTIDVKG